MKPNLDIFSVQRGMVMAPAGCGKTQLIADTLKSYVSDKPVLVLTHTNAGKGALEDRLNKAAISKKAYRVSTIDSWAIRLISKFPARSAHKPEILKLENPGSDYEAVRKAAWNLLSKGDISDILQATYSRLVVDEYQDCTLPQHHIVSWLASILPTCVLGDPLQAIFGFREPTVDWQADVQHFFPSIGELTTPWRWRNAGAEPLGLWLLDARQHLLAGRSIDLRGAPSEVSWIQLPADPNAAHLQRLEAAKVRNPVADGTILIIGDSKNPSGQRQFASHTPGATTVEAVDHKDLTAFGRTFDPYSTGALKTLVDFASEMMTNLGATDLQRRVEILARGSARKEASATEVAALTFKSAPSFSTSLDALRAFADAPGVRVYRPEVLHVCKSAMQAMATGECSFYEAVVRARERNRHLARPMARRAVGSTLLLKGLEADVAIVLNPSAMSAQNLYVALTRGARSLIVCSQTPILTPAG